MKDMETLRRLDELATRNEHLEKKLMALQEAFVCFVSWTGQTAGSPLGASDTKMVLERLK